MAGGGYGSGGYGSIPWGSSFTLGPISPDASLGPFLKVTESDDALRIAPVGWTPIDGSFVLTLGSDTAGRLFDFVDGDSIEVAQNGDFETDRFFSLTTHIRGPESMPTGTRWIAEILIDSVVYAQREILPGREKDLFDMAANVSRFTGDHVLSFRLRFEADTSNVFEVELPAWYLDGLKFSLA